MHKGEHRPAVKRAVWTLLAIVAAVWAPVRSSAAQDAGGRCATPDSIVIRGNARVADQKIRTEVGFSAGAPLNFPAIQRGIKALYALIQSVKQAYGL